QEDQSARRIGCLPLLLNCAMFVLGQRSPARTIGDEQAARRRVGQVKIGSNGDHARDGHTKAAFLSSPLCGTGVGGDRGRLRSSLSSETSRHTCLCSRQNTVSVEAKVPFSKNLLPGGPPPQKPK